MPDPPSILDDRPLSPVPVIQIDNGRARQKSHSQFTESANFARAFYDKFPQNAPAVRSRGSASQWITDRHDTGRTRRKSGPP
jgi:hypothetical protein